MRTIVVSAAIASFSIVALSGCMMMGMCGVMGSKTSQEGPDKEPIVKEVTYGDHRIVATFPLLQRNKQALLSLHVYSLNDASRTSSDVRIIVTIVQRSNGEENVLLDEILTQSDNGAYEFSFVPQEKETYHIAFLIERVGDTQLEKPLILSADQEM